jgi:hypothetical protein
VKKLAERPEFSAQSVALPIADLHYEFPLLDVSHVVDASFASGHWAAGSERASAVGEAVATRVAADQALRERTESPDLADLTAEADERLHLNLSDEEKDGARGRLADFLDRSTKEQFAVFAWLMSHYAASSEFTVLLQHARTTQAAQRKFKPTL